MSGEFTYGEAPSGWAPGQRGAPIQHLDFYEAVMDAAGEWVSTQVDTRAKANSLQQNARKFFDRRGVVAESATRREPSGGFRVYVRTTA